MEIRILILENRAPEIRTLKYAFTNVLKNQCTLHFVPEEELLLKKLPSGIPFDLVIVDALYGDGKRNGLELISKIRSVDIDVPVVAISEMGNVNLVAKSIQAGANDFLVKGDHMENRVYTLIAKMKNIINLVKRNSLLYEQNKLLRESAQNKYHIITKSPEMIQILDQVERVAKVPRPVLITGERGIGKELIAHAIHQASRPRGPMIVVNCAAFPDNLLESELFGHVKGAFTGADSVKIGKFDQANNGTLFLDEIGNMSIPFQQKILRVVEYGTYNRLGGMEEIKTTARIIAATNVGLKDKMLQGEFLRDLYDRLSFEVIPIPALRERKEDIELLSRQFLEQFMKEIPAFQGKRLSESAIRTLRKYSFPGNVRELKNIIERAAYRDTTNEITPEDIGLLPKHQKTYIKGRDFSEKVDNFKISLILEAMKEAQNNQAQAARVLGLGYHQFRYYLNKYHPKLTVL